MFKSFLAPAFLLLCAFIHAAGQTSQTPPPQPQTALPPEAITEPVRAIKAPRTPFPNEKDSAGVNRFSFDPDTRQYIQDNAAQKITLDRIAKPAYEPGDGAYHYVLVKVDGDRISLEVIGVDWGRNYQPYRSNKADLDDKE